MSDLDDIFQNPLPKIKVHKGLFGLYANDCLLDAQAGMWSEEDLKKRLTDVRGYLQFLNKLNDSVVQEISDVDNQVNEIKGIDN